MDYLNKFILLMISEIEFERLRFLQAVKDLYNNEPVKPLDFVAWLDQEIAIIQAKIL